MTAPFGATHAEGASFLSGDEFMLQTEYHFELPRGFVDQEGTLHRKGIMRLANAADEIIPLRDPMVQQNPAYLTIAILARVITSLGTLERITKQTIEQMFTADLAYLQDLYERINGMEAPVYHGVCPHCGETVEIPINFTEAGD